MTGFDGIPAVDFDGADSGEFRVLLLAVDATRPSLVQSLVLDGVNHGYIELVEAYGYDDLIVSVANTSSATTTAAYTYICDVIAAGIFSDGFESGDTSRWSATSP